VEKVSDVGDKLGEMNLSYQRVLFLATSLVVLQAIVLFSLGQPAICECGYLKFWEGEVLSSGNSQHLFDWYTFSHVIHGFVFYWILTLTAPRLSLRWRLLLALGVEVTWEVVENTPWLIDHYRQQALAQGYVGDSVINSISDTLAAALGFLIAWRMPILVVIALALAMELFVGYSIRDNLTLNVLGFFYRPEFIATWQAP